MSSSELLSTVSTIHLAADHAGYELKEVVKDFLEGQGYTVVDHGAHELNPEDDYTDFVIPAAKAVADRHETGIIFGGSGQGEAIVANRFFGVRAVVFNGQYQPGDGRDVPHEVQTARQHNDANILSLGARFLDREETLQAVLTFLDTPFSGDERHLRRIINIDKMLWSK